MRGACWRGRWPHQGIPHLGPPDVQAPEFGQVEHGGLDIRLSSGIAVEELPTPTPKQVDHGGHRLALPAHTLWTGQLGRETSPDALAPRPLLGAEVRVEPASPLVEECRKGRAVPRREARGSFSFGPTGQTSQVQRYRRMLLPGAGPAHDTEPYLAWTGRAMTWMRLEWLRRSHDSRGV